MKKLNRERFFFDEFTGMFGCCEFEEAMAEICNKAKDDGCLIADVHFDSSDIRGDKYVFIDLLSCGWFVESYGRYRLCAEAIRRIHKRFPNL